jgi:hypothetical protein
MSLADGIIAGIVTIIFVGLIIAVVCDAETAHWND